MKRFAFKMKLKPGCEKEYEKRHAAIWPELVDMIHQQGVSNYSIYWDKETNLLFAYQECAGEGSSQDTSAVDPITQKWWDMVANESAKGIAQAAMKSGVPVLNGILTTDSIEQAVERAGTKAGNKGADAMISAIEMVNLNKEL